MHDSSSQLRLLSRNRVFVVDYTVYVFVSVFVYREVLLPKGEMSVDDTKEARPLKKGKQGTHFDSSCCVFTFLRS